MGLLKKLTKPLSKFLDKIVPNELKPALPYLSAFAPFMMGPTGIMGSSMLRRGLMSGALNIGSQLAQEGSEGDVDWLSAALAGGIGAMSAPGSEKVMGVDKFGNEMIRPGSPSAAKFFETRAGGMDPGWMKSGTEMLGTGAEYLTGAGETLRADPFSIPGMKAALVPATAGTADLARISAEQELKRLEDEEDETGIGINDDMTRKSLRRAMEMAGHLEEDILSALDALGLREGGIVGLKHGGQLVKRGLGRPGYGGPHETEAAGKSYEKATSSGGGGGDAWQRQALKDFSKLSSTKSGGTGTTTGPSADDIKMIQESIKEVPTKVIGNEIRNLLQLGKVPQYGIGTLEDDTTLMAELTDSQKDWINKEKSNLKRGFKEPQHVFETINNPALGKFEKNTLNPFKGPQDPTTPQEFNDYLKEILPDTTLSQVTMTSKDGGRVGALGGGIMHAKRGLVDAPGGYAGDKEEIDFGGITEAVTAVEKTPKKFLVDKLEVTVMPGQSEKMAIVNAMINDTDGIMPDDRKQEFYRLFLPQLRASGEISETEYNGLMGELFKANGGRINKNIGGMMSVLPKGREMDYRGGGVIPIGSRERADDVPARLSKNEFVMTADAVKAAGGGSVNKGAKKMYNLMHNLEARV